MTFLQKCCFFWDTRQGCIAIGYTAGVLSIIFCMGSVIRLFLGLPLVIQNDDMQGQFPFNALFFVFGAVYFAVHAAASFILVPAVQESQELFMIPSMVITIVDITLDCTAIIVMATGLSKRDDFLAIYTGGTAFSAAILPLLVYSLLVVASHFEYLFRRPDKVPLNSSKRLKKSFLMKRESTDSSEQSLGPTTI